MKTVKSLITGAKGLNKIPTTASKITLQKSHEYEFHLKNKLKSIIDSISKSINSFSGSTGFMNVNGIVKSEGNLIEESYNTKSKMEK